MSCVKSKREEPATPKDLYTSPYFRKMRRYAEEVHDDWWILSAEHGLVHPDGEPMAPYEKTLKNASKAEREEWADQVLAEMEHSGLLEGVTTVVIHAGKDYYGELVPLLDEYQGIDVELPTQGLAFGETLAWYNEQFE
ncbi:hypothetical protein OB920_07720 [Halobacteria archaeon HArc-gm2]|nr:hypothetical protein [Halobacteria archaeon HArc-gm2]